MALKFSEMAARRVDLARNLEAGFDNYKEEIAAGYETFVVPLLAEGETAPDVRFEMELMKRGVARSRQRLASFDTPILEQKHEDAQVSAEIDRRKEAVEVKLRGVRHVCRGMFGEPGVTRIGLKEEPPFSAFRLWEHGKTAKDSLARPDLGLEPVIKIETGEGVATPAAQMSTQLEPELGELGELVGNRHQANRKGADVRSRRQQALAEFDRDVRGIVRTAQGMFRLAGRHDLAERFRPLLKRIARKKKTEDEANGQTEAESAEVADKQTSTESA